MKRLTSSANLCPKPNTKVWTCETHYEMPAYLVKMIRKYEHMSSDEREDVEGKKLREMIHVVGTRSSTRQQRYADESNSNVCIAQESA